MADETQASTLLELATELTIAWLANPNTRASAEEVPAFLQTMHGAVTNLSSQPATTEVAAPTPEYTPAVSVRKSLASKDHIISMIDGKAYKTLKRHLSGHGLTPAQYRERYGLKADYPMVAESYAEMRRSVAKTIGLGREPGRKAAPKGAAKRVATKPAAAIAKSDAGAAQSAAAKAPAAAKPAAPKRRTARAKAAPAA